MNWKDCVRESELYGIRSRFEWPVGEGQSGFDCNPDAFTINDIWGAIGWIWTWPGDLLLSLPKVQSFFLSFCCIAILGAILGAIEGLGDRGG